MSACSGCGSRLWQEMKFCAECGTKVTSSPPVEQITSARPASSPKQISFALIPIVCEEPKIIPEVPPPPPKRQNSTLVGGHRNATPVLKKSNSQPNMSPWVNPNRNSNPGSLRNSAGITPPSSINNTMTKSPPTHTSAPSSPRSEICSDFTPSSPPSTPPSHNFLSRSLPNTPNKINASLSYNPLHSKSYHSVSPSSTNQVPMSFSPPAVSPLRLHHSSDEISSSSIVSSAVSLPNLSNRVAPPPPPPLSKKPRYSQAPPTKQVTFEPISPRLTATYAPLIQLNTTNTVAKQGDKHTMPSSENEVILVKSTYNVETPPPAALKSVAPSGPVRKATSPELLLKCSVDGKRMSFNTVVAMAVGHDGSEYQAKIVGYENRIETIDSTSHTATLYKIEVHKDNQTWFVYRRYGQFSKLAQKLREKKLLSSIGLKANFPLKKLDVQQSLLALDNYLNTLLSRSEVASSHYISNFLQPLQLGDSKPQNC